MNDTPTKRGRKPTGGERRQIRLPADMLAAWDAASTDDIRAILRAGLLGDAA